VILISDRNDLSTAFITTGLWRSYVEVEVTGPNRDISGLYMVVCKSNQYLAKNDCHDENTILFIPGFMT
jgi:hypothetical protein